MGASTMRTSVAMAALDAIDAEQHLRYAAVAACVGEAAALEYQTWEQSLDLPDPEDWITAAINHRNGNGGGGSIGLAIPARCDQVMAALGALVARVKNHSLGPDGKSTAEALACGRGLPGGSVAALA